MTVKDSATMEKERPQPKVTLKPGTVVRVDRKNQTIKREIVGTTDAGYILTKDSNNQQSVVDEDWFEELFTEQEPQAILLGYEN